MLEIIVEIEWLVIGVIFFYGIRRWNKRFTQLYNEMTAEDEED
jgi:hypothetical protein